MADLEDPSGRARFQLREMQKMYTRVTAEHFKGKITTEQRDLYRKSINATKAHFRAIIREEETRRKQVLLERL